MTRMVRAIIVCLLWAGTLARVLADSVPQSTPLGDDGHLLLKDLQGRAQNLDQYRGKIVVLNFWATWCIPCREEMPLLVSLQKRYGDRGIQVVGASADDESTRAKVLPFVQKMKLNFPVWLGATTVDLQRFGLGEALPATAVIDRDGRIVSRILGPLEKDDLTQRMEWLLSDRHTPSPPALVNKIKKHDHPHEHGHKEEGEEEHEHGAVSIEGASTVPS